MVITSNKDSIRILAKLFLYFVKNNELTDKMMNLLEEIADRGCVTLSEGKS